MDSDDLGWLLAVAKGGSLSAAAKARGVAVSTVARRLDALENALKLRLIDRRADGARLTDEGARIAALAEPAIASTDRIVRAATAMRSGAERPSVVVSATEFVLSEVLAPALPNLWRTLPGVAITLRSQMEVVSLAAREADLAIRMSCPEGASLIARKLTPFRLGLFASETYLQGREPGTLNFAKERLLVPDDSFGRIPELDWLDTARLTSAVALRTGSVRTMLNAAIAGFGIGLLPEIFAKRYALIELPVPISLPARTPWIITHRDLRRLPAIMSVHQWLRETFRTVFLH